MMEVHILMENLEQDHNGDRYKTKTQIVVALADAFFYSISLYRREHESSRQARISMGIFWDSSGRDRGLADGDALICHSNTARHHSIGNAAGHHDFSNAADDHDNREE